jgi:hypothetical protein
MTTFSFLKEMTDDLESTELLRQVLISIYEKLVDVVDDIIYDMTIDELVNTIKTEKESLSSADTIEAIHTLLDNTPGWDSKSLDDRSPTVTALLHELQNSGVIKH